MATVQVKFGDMFNGPTDLIVIPCSTVGTITSIVKQRLIRNKIPYPNRNMKLGDIMVFPFTGGENIAQYFAYAASVEISWSTKEAIENISKKLGAETKKISSIRIVSVPLLGTGAGGLDIDSSIEALSTGFVSTAHRDAHLIIYVLEEWIYSHISQKYVNNSSEIKRHSIDSTASRVFISYSHTSKEHEDWVEDLGKFLRENGIDARLDIWHLRHGMDLPQFMTNELTLADRVILISDEHYAEKADGRLGGVGWETMIIQGDISRLSPESTKYLVVVRSKNIDNGLPKYLQTKFVIHWPNESVDETNKQILLRELFDQVVVPPLGNKPVFL